MPEDPPPRFSKAAENLIAALRRLPDESPRRMRTRATKDLGLLVEEILVKHQIGRASPEQAIRDQWAVIVGTANASYSHPARVERNLLVVLASHSVVRNELFHHRKTITEKIQALPGCADIRGINVRPG